MLLVRRGAAQFERLIEVPATHSTWKCMTCDRRRSIGLIEVPLTHEDFKGLAAYIENTIGTQLGKPNYGSDS